jgi:hypothetical protein
MVELVLGAVEVCAIEEQFEDCLAVHDLPLLLRVVDVINSNPLGSIVKGLNEIIF